MPNRRTISEEACVKNPLSQLQAIIDRAGGQRPVAKLLGVSESHLSEVMNRKTGISAGFAHKAEKVFGLSAKSLMRFQADEEYRRYCERHGIEQRSAG
jgi:plasmid maintenance system antidote protein VapI